MSVADALPPVCILAGGVGSRLGDVVTAVPKPLVEVAGRPFLHHQLDLLRSAGARDIVLCTGYLGAQIKESVGDGAAFGLSVEYSDDGRAQIGTAGAVRKAADLLGPVFMVLYGDTYLRIDYAEVARTAARSGCAALMTVLQNEGRWDTSNVEFDGRVVVRYNKFHPDASMRYIDYGLSVLTPAALAVTPDAGDLADVFTALVGLGQLAGYEALERFYEIGTPAALAETGAFLKSRRPR